MFDEDRLQDRLQKEKRFQSRARTTRNVLRWITHSCALAVLSFGAFAYLLNEEWLLAGACVFSLPTVICYVVLFFLGGIAPSGVRSQLSRRERDLLDN